MVNDVNNSSLQLVEMCSSKGVWSPVCDNNWTLQDATVVCRELNDQGLPTIALRAYAWSQYIAIDCIYTVYGLQL